MDRLKDEFVFDVDEPPEPVKDAYKHVMKISVEHGELAVLCFLPYTVTWGRKTEHFLLWSHGGSSFFSRRLGSVGTSTPG